MLQFCAAAADCGIECVTLSWPQRGWAKEQFPQEAWYPDESHMSRAGLEAFAPSVVERLGEWAAPGSPVLFVTDSSFTAHDYWLQPQNII